MTIPEDKQEEFRIWFKQIAGPGLGKFGAIKHELFKVEDKELIGRQTAERNRYIERIYFDDDYDIPSYFVKVKADPEAWGISRGYEEKFGATNIELRVLAEPRG